MDKTKTKMALFLESMGCTHHVVCRGTVPHIWKQSEKHGRGTKELNSLPAPEWAHEERWAYKAAQPTLLNHAKTERSSTFEDYVKEKCTFRAKNRNTTYTKEHLKGIESIGE